MKKSYFLILPLLAFATPGQAQDLNGFRVELVGALDEIEIDLGASTNQFNPVTDRDVDAAYGVGVGYDFLRGRGVGLGVDVEFTESTSRQPVIVNTVTANNGIVGEAFFGVDLYAGGRVTVPLGRFNLVGKVGYTALELEYKITNATLAPNYQDDRLKGVRGGIGFQYVGDDEDNIYYGAEYRYSNYEKNVVRHQVALVLGHRF